jgi:hypothetical protein
MIEIAETALNLQNVPTITVFALYILLKYAIPLK